MRLHLASLLALALVFGSTSTPASAHHDDARPTLAGLVAQSDGVFDNRNDFDILRTALDTAGLTDALASTDVSWTVFAPTDRAFIRTARDLGYDGRDEAGTWEFLVGAFTALGGGDPIPVLTDVLLYHVAPERIGAFRLFFRTFLYSNPAIPTLLEGATIGGRFLTLADNEPDLRNPRVILRRAQQGASNGILHPINRVLIPLDL